MKHRSKLFGPLLVALLTGVAIAATDPGGGDEPVDIAPSRGFVLRLGELAFDPAQGVPELPEGWRASPADDPDLHLVQFDGPIGAGALARLRDGGLEPVQYIHPHTYIVWGRRSDRTSLAPGGPIRWTGDFAPAYRVLPQWRSLPADPVDIKALICSAADADLVAKNIVALGATPGARLRINDKLEVAGFRLPGDRIQAAAKIAGVYSIQLQSTDGGSRGEVSDQISAGNVDGMNLAFPGYQSWLAGLGLDGTGVVVANVDEGIDQAHPDLSARVVQCTGASCEDRRSWHGTHTAGIIAGDATMAEMDAAGFLRGLGAAPGATLLEQNYRPTYQEAGGMLRLMTDSSFNGAVISSNAWGPSGIAHGYDIDTLLVDAGVRDADPETAGNQSLIYVQAINNGNGGISSQATPDDAKNILTIGTTDVLGPPDGMQVSEIDNLAFSTGHGPALDGRTIPHMVAPGCYADSTWWREAEDFGYRALCGSSVAASHVSGAAALFVEYFRGLPDTTGDPSPAMVKAAILPVAHDLDGSLDADDTVMGHRPDSKQGWGRLNLAAVVDPQDEVLYFDAPTTFEFSGQEWTRVATAANPAAPMRVMLVWTDAPGHGLGGNTPAWNNDLDLQVEAGGQIYLGNVFGADGFSAPGGPADAMNNAEGVFLPQVAAEATIRVTATDINSNGVPHFGDDTDQDFALVCYNCALVPDFAMSTDTTSLGICAPDVGELSIDVEQLAGFGNPVTLGTVGVPAGAAASFSENPVTPTGNSMLIVDPGTAAAGDYTMQVHGDSDTLNRSFSVEVRVRTGAPAPATLTAPPSGAVAVATKPVLQWSAVPWTDHYLVEMASDPGFVDIVYNAVADGTSHVPRFFLRQQATYFWRVRATNPCGYGSFSTMSSFTTTDTTDLLLVDDDYDLPDEQNEYRTALDALGVSYDLWDVWAVHIGGEPGPEVLALYDRVIWFSGQEENYPGPNNDSEAALPDWLDRGSCLLITSTDYVLAQLGITEFMQQRLGLASVTEDTGQTLVTGQGAAFAGLGPYTLANQNPDYRDSLSPDATAELAFAGDLGDAGINKDGGWYRTSFLGFGVESTSTGETTQILGAFLSWCGGLPGIDGDGDGVLNADDCAPGDAAAWTLPSPITDLALGKGAVGFSWSEPVSGSGSTYDVLRSGNPDEWYDATCVAAGTSRTWAVPDETDPEPGEVFYYLVGAASECGVSTLGNQLDGAPRYGTACDPETTWWD